MFKFLRNFWEKIRSRRNLRRKGLIATRRKFDLETLFDTLEGSPAPGIFMLVLIWTVSTVLLTFSAQQLKDVPNLVVGQQAPRTIIARLDFSYKDEESTDLEVRQAMEKIPLYFRIDAKSSNRIRRNFSAMFEAVGRRIAEGEAEKTRIHISNDLPDQLVAEASPQLLLAIGDLMRSPDDYKEFDAHLNQILDRGILNRTRRDAMKVGQTLRIIDQEQRKWPEKNAIEQDDPHAAARKLAVTILRNCDGSVREELKTPLTNLFLSLIGEKGNLVSDDSLYQAERLRAAENVKDVMVSISEGDLLVLRDQEVTPEVVSKLKAYEAADRSNRKFDLDTLTHNAIWSLVLVIFAAFCLHHLHPELIRVNKRVMLLGLVVLLSMLANFVGFRFFHWLPNRPIELPNELVAEAIPIALGAVLLAVIMGYRVALCVSFFLALFAAMMMLPERSFDLTVKGMVICSLAALAVRPATNYRSYFIRILLSVFPLVWILNLNLLNVHSPNRIILLLLGQSAVIAFANAAATAILALLLIFTFEIVLNVSTNMSLMVLCDYNHPLLERLKREAPGTFFHSLMVATLAEDAARAIGANPLKAKAGALFHDIGKLSMPQYFTENNLGSANRHLDLNPQMSSIIIRDHVKEGLALARQYRMCRTVRDAIRQHHGNDLVRFFYRKALEEQARTHSAPVLESQFRYDGIPPQDREMAIISLADACEAACRSIDKPSASKIETLVGDIFRGRFEGRQLNYANITLAELEKVRQSFINTLVSMKHGRIAYQQEKERDHNEHRMGSSPSSPSPEKTSCTAR